MYLYQFYCYKSIHSRRIINDEEHSLLDFILLYIPLWIIMHNLPTCCLELKVTFYPPSTNFPGLQHSLDLFQAAYSRTTCQRAEVIVFRVVFAIDDPLEYSHGVDVGVPNRTVNTKDGL